MPDALSAPAAAAVPAMLSAPDTAAVPVRLHGRDDAALPVVEPLGEGAWRAGPRARGPFAGVQGGVVAGLMLAEVERAAPPGFRPLALRADLLRPVPLGASIEVRVTPVQAGRRLAVFDALLEVEGQVKARCAVTLASAVAVPALAAAEHVSDPLPPAPDPEVLSPRTVRAPHGEAWLMDVVDPRLGPDGSVWFRWRAPMLPGAVSAFVAALGPADFAHGLARPGLPGPSPVPGFPNADLTVHFDRAPRGPWIGVRPATRWRRDGLGIGHGDLVDREGSFGRVAMGVVLIPG